MIPRQGPRRDTNTTSESRIGPHKELNISRPRCRLSLLWALAFVALVAGCAHRLVAPTDVSSSDPGAVARGEYLATAANCAGCHTDKDHGGARFAGGRAIDTPFGAFYSRNITPDPQHGIGARTDADFLTALRTGTSPTGAHYFAAFPFTSFTLMTDRDILDIKAYLFTQPPAATVNRPHDVPFPFDMRLAMVPWRALYFTEGPFVPTLTRSAEWNRGAYLATAVVHCPECHTPRNLLGALESDRHFAGAPVYGPGHNYAPNITGDPHDGIGTWPLANITDLLSLGITPKGDFVAGPMAEVVAGTAKLTDADRHAIAVYVKSLPPLPSPHRDEKTG